MSELVKERLYRDARECSLCHGTIPGGNNQKIMGIHESLCSGKYKGDDE